MIKAVIFDMDGIIIDSEPIASEVVIKVLKEYGKEPIFHPDGNVQEVGITDLEDWTKMKARYHLDEDVQVLIDKMQKLLFDRLNSGIEPMPGLIELLDFLEEKKVKIGLASSSGSPRIELILSKLGIRDRFKTIISGESLVQSKPHPEIYEKAAQMLGEKPENCLALEDAEHGVESAYQANLKVIAIPNSSTKNQNFTHATKIINSLADLNWDILSSL